MAALPPLEVNAPKSARTTESVPERSPTSVLSASLLSRPKSAAASVASSRPRMLLTPSASALPTTRGISPSWDLRGSEVPSISGRTRHAFLEEDDPGALARERMQGCTARPSRRHRELAMGRRDERSCSRVYREGSRILLEANALLKNERYETCLPLYEAVIEYPMSDRQRFSALDHYAIACVALAQKEGMPENERRELCGRAVALWTEAIDIQSPETGDPVGEGIHRSRMALRCGELCQERKMWKRAVRCYRRSIVVDDGDAPSTYSKLAHRKIGECLDALTLQKNTQQ